MQLPAFRRNQTMQPPTKFPASSLKMAVTHLDDIHMIKFKQGWFTLVKYDEQVGEKKNQSLREELVEFSKANQIDKPRTWIHDLKFENKFKEAAPQEEFKRSQTETAKPKSQSKVALKRQRAKQLATGGKGIGLTGFKKMNLKLGKEAVTEDPVEEQKEEVKLEEKEEVEEPQTALAPPIKEPPSLMPPSKKQLTIAPPTETPPTRTELTEPATAQTQVLSGQTMSEAVTSQPPTDAPPTQPASPPKLNIETIIEDTSVTDPKTKEAMVALHVEQSGPALEYTDPVDFISLPPNHAKHHSQNQFGTMRNSGNGTSFGQSNGEHQALNLGFNSSGGISGAFGKGSGASGGGESLEEQTPLQRASVLQNLVEESPTIYLPQRSAKFSEVCKSDMGHASASSVSEESLQQLFSAIGKVQAKRILKQWKNYNAQSRRREFQIRVYSYMHRHQHLRKLRKAFNEFKFFTQNLRVKAVTEDKRRIYTKYCRRIIQIKAQTKPSLKDAFEVWKTYSSIERKLEVKMATYPLSIEEEADQMANSLQIRSLHLHRDTIDTVQNNQRIQLPEPGVEIQREITDQVYFRELEFDPELFYDFKVRHSHLFAAKLFSKLAQANKRAKLESFHKMKEVTTCSLVKQTTEILKRIKKNMSYLKDQKQQMKKYLPPADRLEKSVITDVSPISINEGSFINREGKSLSTVKKVICNYDEIRKTSVAPTSVSIASEESFLVALQPQLQDKDDQFLTHIDRRLTESLALIKLLSKVRRQFFLHRTVTEPEMSEVEQIRMIETQNKKIEAVSKIMCFNFKLSCCLIDGKVSQLDVPSSFKKWAKLSLTKKIQSVEESNTKAQKLLFVQAARLLDKHLPGTSWRQSLFFDRWKSMVVIDRYRSRFQLPSFTSSVLIRASQGNRAPGLEFYEEDPAAKNFARGTRRGKVILNSDNISFNEKKRQTKATAFMKIKSLLLQNYICRGTKLQRSIDSLKDLARKQKMLLQGLNMDNHLPIRSTKAEMQAQRQAIEHKVADLILEINRIIFERWVLFTHNEIQRISKPKSVAIIRLCDGVLHSSIQRQKLQAITRVHLYSLYIVGKQELRTGQAREELQNPQFPLFNHQASVITGLSTSIKSVEMNGSSGGTKTNLQKKYLKSLPISLSAQLHSKALALYTLLAMTRTSELKRKQRRFNSWKFKVALFEWKMSQSVSSVQVNPFLESHMTPKNSVSLHGNVSSPWEVKELREQQKRRCIARAGMQAESLLRRQVGQMSYRGELDGTALRLVNCSFTRLKQNSAFAQWRLWLREQRKRGSLARPSEKRFSLILQKFQRNRLARKFAFWKYMARINPNSYNFSMERIDESMIKTLAMNQQTLSEKLKESSDLYKLIVRRKVMTKALDHMAHSNPLRAAFKQWKNAVCLLMNNKDDLYESQREKVELKQQYDLLHQQNEDLKQDIKQQIQGQGGQCSDCREMQLTKLEDLTHMEFNRQHYNELTQMVGMQINGALFSNPLHLDEDLINKPKPATSNNDSYIKFATGSVADEDDYGENTALKRELAQKESSGLQRQRTQGDSQLNKFEEDIRSHQQDRKYSVNQRPIQFGQGDLNSSNSKITKEELSRIDQIGSETESNFPKPPPGTGLDTRIITGAGGQADELAHMIEQENEKLRTKADEMREQYQIKIAMLDEEKARYMEKIKRLSALRDELSGQWYSKQ